MIKSQTGIREEANEKNKDDYTVEYVGRPPVEHNCVQEDGYID